MKEKVSIFWFRRDLRVEDNAALYHALKHSQDQVLPIFIFDRNILDDLTDRSDPRVTFIYDELQSVNHILKQYNSVIRCFYSTPMKVWKKLTKEFDISAVYLNRDYEPYAKQRDGEVKKFLATNDVQLHSFKDHVVFESNEIRKDDGEPYVVFTPYKKRWLAKLDTRLMNGSSFYLSSYPTTNYSANFHRTFIQEMPSLKSMNFTRSPQAMPSKEVRRSIIKNYAANRDFPARPGTSKLGIHFRFGTISIREKAMKARKLSDVFLSENNLERFLQSNTGLFSACGWTTLSC